MQREKRKPGEIIKTAAASLAFVAMFGIALMGANHLAFANASNNTLEIEQPEAMSVTQTLNVAAHDGNMGVSIANALSVEQTPRRTFTIIESTIYTWPWNAPPESFETALSAEEATQIGAQYIYEIFGEDIDGATVQMTFNAHMRHRNNTGVWTGVVGDGVQPDDVDFEMNIGTPLFLFMLNAETGEAIHVERMSSFLGEEFIILTPRSDVRVQMEMSIQGFYPFRIYGFYEGFDIDEIFYEARNRIAPELFERREFTWEGWEFHIAECPAGQDCHITECPAGQDCTWYGHRVWRIGDEDFSGLCSRPVFRSFTPRVLHITPQGPQEIGGDNDRNI
ncbi:MAG: hypothetical protein FWC71_06990 [Defluviitaleaceae bacterium]|nr:hypothetical protein [Defluviitaleaceae bacterium]